MCWLTGRWIIFESKNNSLQDEVFRDQSWHVPFFQALYIFTQEESVSWECTGPQKPLSRYLWRKQGKIPWVQLPSTVNLRMTLENLIPPVAMMCVDWVICERQVNELYVQLVLESLVLLSNSWQDCVLVPLPLRDTESWQGEEEGVILHLTLRIIITISVCKWHVPMGSVGVCTFV